MNENTIQGYRLSLQQQRIWRQQIEHDFSSIDNSVCCVVRVPDALHLPHLASALQRLIARHEILRTTFHLLPGMSFPLQVVL
ncbi:MAG TPA: hypothetical protein VD835_12795, partial [Pyrinomonadaceae bacterium]|nr:hypothetical protein [Pyrinomonadaceae bacterium]